MAYKSKVYAGKVNTYAHVVTDETICLGEIEFNTLNDAFIKTLRLYNKNANKHIYNPQFMYRGNIYFCDELGEPSKSGRGYTQYWCLHKVAKGPKMPVTWFDFDQRHTATIEDSYMAMIPKKKVNQVNAILYIE